MQSISGKAYGGLKYRAVTKYGETKEYVLQTLGDLKTAMVLVSVLIMDFGAPYSVRLAFQMEYAKNTAAWANGKTIATLTTAQEQTKNLWHEIQRHSEPVGKKVRGAFSVVR